MRHDPEPAPWRLANFGNFGNLGNSSPVRISVECYAGHRGEQTPRVVILGDRRITVVEVLDAWLDPDHRYFKVKGDDGDTYLVRHDERSGLWELTLFRARERESL
jgi:hypothetical protein